MLGGLLGQLQNQYAAQPTSMPTRFAAGNMQQPTRNTMRLMGLEGMSPSGFTPNYTGLFGMMGQQPQLNQTRTMAQNDYLNRVMGQPQQAPQTQPTGGLIGGWTPAAVQAMMAGAPQNIIDLYQQYPNRSKDMLYWATSGFDNGGA